jgi:hypothetical protein
MDGHCDPTGAPANNQYNSYNYTASAEDVACAAATTPSATGSATLMSPSTLCCQ